MRRLWLILAAVAFVGWLSYLSFAALTKNRGPVISRAQAAAAKVAIVASVEAEGGKPLSKVKVSETLWGNGPPNGAEIEVENLPSASDKSGFVGPGEYLLLLTAPSFRVVGQQRSPGNDVAHTGPPLIYRWTDGVKMDFASLPRLLE